MVFSAVFVITDGIFVGRRIGSDALAASNIVYPAINVVFGLAIMLASGGLFSPRISARTSRSSRASASR